MLDHEEKFLFKEEILALATALADNGALDNVEDLLTDVITSPRFDSEVFTLERSLQVMLGASSATCAPPRTCWPCSAWPTPPRCEACTRRGQPRAFLRRSKHRPDRPPPAGAAAFRAPPRRLLSGAAGAFVCSSRVSRRHARRPAGLG